MVVPTILFMFLGSLKVITIPSLRGFHFLNKDYLNRPRYIVHLSCPYPMRVSLAPSVRQSTRSTDPLSTLNHFGHCISKSKLQEIASGIVEEHTKSQGFVILPSHIVPGVPVAFVWDTNDIIMQRDFETLHTRPNYKVQRGSIAELIHFKYYSAVHIDVQLVGKSMPFVYRGRFN